MQLLTTVHNIFDFDILKHQHYITNTPLDIYI